MIFQDAIEEKVSLICGLKPKQRKEKLCQVHGSTNAQVRDRDVMQVLEWQRSNLFIYLNSYFKIYCLGKYEHFLIEPN